MHAEDLVCLMQTFLPYRSYSNSAECLDYRRLGKQRVESYQILRVLLGKSKGWANHPAVKMWRGYEGSLALYSLTICSEWRSRGFKDTVTEKIASLVSPCDITNSHPPPWLGDEQIHSSHRSNLLRKDSRFYSKYLWTEPDNLPYFWPV